MCALLTHPLQSNSLSLNEAFDLDSKFLGALPIVNHFLTRLQMETLLGKCLPPPDPRVSAQADRAPEGGVGVTWNLHFNLHVILKIDAMIHRILQARAAAKGD